MYSRVHSIVLFYLWLTFSNLIMACFGVVFIIFLRLRICWTSWIEGFIIFIKYRKVWPWFHHIFFCSSLSFRVSNYMYFMLPNDLTAALLMFWQRLHFSVFHFGELISLFFGIAHSAINLNQCIFHLSVDFISEFHLNLPYLYLCSVF